MHCDITANNNSFKGKEQEITVTVAFSGGHPSMY